MISGNYIRMAFSSCLQKKIEGISLMMRKEEAKMYNIVYFYNPMNNMAIIFQGYIASQGRQRSINYTFFFSQSQFSLVKSCYSLLPQVDGQTMQKKCICNSKHKNNHIPCILHNCTIKLYCRNSIDHNNFYIFYKYITMAKKTSGM